MGRFRVLDPPAPRRQDPDLGRRLRQQRDRGAAARRADRLGSRAHSQRRHRTPRHRCPRCDARRARAVGLPAARADQWRAGESDRRGHPDRPRGRSAGSARRLPIDRSAADRCRRTRCRRTLGHRAQMAARTARHRIPLPARRIGADHGAGQARSAQRVLGEPDRVPGGARRAPRGGGGPRGGRAGRPPPGPRRGGGWARGGAGTPAPAPSTVAAQVSRNSARRMGIRVICCGRSSTHP